MNNPSSATATNAPSAAAHKRKGVTRANDTTLAWVQHEYPQLEAWRELAVQWLQGETQGVSTRLGALGAFLERYIVRHGLPVDPAMLLARSTVLPDFFQTACQNSPMGINYANNIHAFLNFVLLLKFSLPADDGHPVISSAYHNPVARRSTSGMPKLGESVHSPLPYGYIDALRQILVAGPDFKDWQWAQSALGAAYTSNRFCAPDWFPVSEDQIDRDDSDCMYRIRHNAQSGGGPVLEMWSPVRWVALLVKLLLPLRTVQVRMLDSGEADTWRYESGNWVLNPGRLILSNEGRPHQQGVLRRTAGADGSVRTRLYANTNKTADTAKVGSEKGFTFAWPEGGSFEHVHQHVYYWLEKIRNWQEKYNPIERRTRWADLDGRQITAKSDVQLAAYPDTCFLFRLPEASAGERHMPLTDGHIKKSWFSLLKALEQRLLDQSETHANGAPIRFLPPMEVRNSRVTTLFPLHSLRVSLVTALALEGQVPFPILMKLVGHSRLLMTLYYTKPGVTHINKVMTEAIERLEANKSASIQNFLQNTEHSELLRAAICNSTTSLSAAIPFHPAARNPTHALRRMLSRREHQRD